MDAGDAAMARTRGRAWFERGCKAFKTSFPEFASRIPVNLFYVCPICLQIYTEEALKQRFLTREHIPPQSLGGRRLALTCKPCNNDGGHEADNHARREANLIGFFRGNVSDIKGHLKTASGRMPVRLSAGEGGVQMFGVPKAASQASRDAVTGDFAGATGEGKWEGFEFKLEFETFSPDRAAASWLRSAYLAFFATLGYRFILRPELDAVRERIKNPDLKTPGVFRQIRPQRVAEPALIRVETPDAFRSYMMFYEHQVVALPRYSDKDFYGRLSQQPAGKVTFLGKQYPWPVDGPTFFHDFVREPKPSGPSEKGSVNNAS
jgi:hypothetical protein